MRALRIWRERETIVTYCAGRRKRGDPGMVSVSTVTRKGLKRVATKVKDGRGRKRTAWVVALRNDLVEEFERLRKIGIKFSAKTLRSMAKDLIRNSDSGAYYAAMLSGRPEKPIVDLITARWIQGSMYRYNIVGRSQSGKLQISPEAQVKNSAAGSSFFG